MRLSVRALTIAAAVIWGGCILLTGLIHLSAPSYGTAFLQMVSSIYPGFHNSGTPGDVVVGTLYALVDGGVCGVVFAWLYNALAAGRARA
jgi:hypothetical protein